MSKLHVKNILMVTRNRMLTLNRSWESTPKMQNYARAGATMKVLELNLEVYEGSTDLARSFGFLFSQAAVRP